MSVHSIRGVLLAGFSPVTDLKMRSQERSPLGELEVIPHQEIQKS